MKLASKLSSIIVGGLLLAAPVSAFADTTASVSISGGGNSYTVGSTFSVIVSENSGSQAVNGVKVGVQFSSAMLLPVLLA
jgi:hypothetical protein